jgi:5-methylcytosine-specific restriction enzyme subunit McrC
MNKLWEEYICRILQKHKTIRPDTLITNDNNENFVIDTKWKILNLKLKIYLNY